MLAKKRDEDKKGSHTIVVIEEKELSNEGYATITSNHSWFIPKHIQKFTTGNFGTNKTSLNDKFGPLPTSNQ